MAYVEFDSMPVAKRALMGLKNCMPETKEEYELAACTKCPYVGKCDAYNGKAGNISLPYQLIADLREALKAQERMYDNQEGGKEDESNA